MVLAVGNSSSSNRPHICLENMKNCGKSTWIVHRFLDYLVFVISWRAKRQTCKDFFVNYRFEKPSYFKEVFFFSWTLFASAVSLVKSRKSTKLHHKCQIMLSFKHFYYQNCSVQRKSLTWKNSALVHVYNGLQMLPNT